MQFASKVKLPKGKKTRRALDLETLKKQEKEEDDIDDEDLDAFLDDF